MPIIDIMLPVCATALNVNIQVWQHDNGFKNVLQFDVHPTSSTETIHLLYTRTLNSQGILDPSLDPNNLCHHYDALVLKGNDEDSSGDFSSDEEYGRTTTISPSTPSTPSSGILTYSEKIKYETDDVPLHYVMYNAKKSDWHNPSKQDLSLFDNVVTKVVGTSPFNIDGNKIYQIKCDKYTWKEKLNDGRHWQVNWGKTGDLMVKDMYLNVKDRLCV